MARNGSGVYSLPAGSTIANGDLSDASDLNTPLSDIETDLNTPRPIVAGGTGASSASAARTALGLAIGTDVQAYSAGLASWAGVTRASGFDTFAATPSSANLRALLSDEVGTGAAYFVGGALGTPASGVLTNCTGLTTSGIAAATLVTASEGISSNNNDTTIPTSAAVKDYVDDALSASPVESLTLLGTITTTSGTSQSLNGLDLTGYKFVLCVINGVSFNASDNLRIAGQQASPASGSAAGILYGHVTVDLASGLFWSTVGVVGAVTNSYVGLTGYSTATTSITFAPQGALFDAGSIRVYGQI